MPLITVTAGTPVIPPGTYPATLVGVAPKRLVTKFSVNGEEQDFLEWTWLVEGADKDAEITSLTSLSTGPKSTMFSILTALLGPEAVKIGAGFDEDDLVGGKVMVQIVEQDGFSKVDKVIAAPKGRQTAAAAPKAVSGARGASKPAAAPKPAPESTIDYEDEGEGEDTAPEDDLPF